MSAIDQKVRDFVAKSIEIGDVSPIDKIYITNRLIDLLGKQELLDEAASNPLSEDRLQLLDDLVEYAVQEKVVEDLPSAREVLEAKIMDLITPRPSEVNHAFWEYYKVSPKQATDYFFELSRQTNYIKTREIAQNIEYTHLSKYGEVEITINLSKPEKDPKEIALAKKVEGQYPANVLSIENEGYTGHMAYPGRANHRIIRMELSGELWGFQYSPYAYYNEHAIFLSAEHRPMHVGIQAVKNLLRILTQFPHYFVGSNAGLPIVGGSILSQDHYQGGRYTFPLEKAQVIETFTLPETPLVKANRVKWPMAVVRLSSEHMDELIAAAQKVMEKWKEYSDESVGIHAYTGNIAHNAITPIARRRGKAYELDLVLRNNRTSEEYPDGIFHPHPSVQHIKKENIGLIEVMGLAILPPRLKDELNEVRQYLLNEADSVNPIHQKWADTIKQSNHRLTEENVEQIIQRAVGKVFVEVLEDAGVFKQTKKGDRAFARFIDTLK